KAKCFMYAAGAPLEFWDYATLHAAYVINRLPSEANEARKSPFEVWNEQIPDLDLLRIWGCTAYAIIDKKQRKNGKYGKNALKCVLVRLDGDSGNYLLYNPLTKKVFSTPDVVFDELDFSTI